jgi:hypothetical protein
VSAVTTVALWILDTNFGIVNYLFGTSVAWFQDPTWAMPAEGAVTVWWTVGFNMLLFMAGLQNISRALLDYRLCALTVAQIVAERERQAKLRFRIVVVASSTIWPYSNLEPKSCHQTFTAKTPELANGHEGTKQAFQLQRIKWLKKEAKSLNLQLVPARRLPPPVPGELCPRKFSYFGISMQELANNERMPPKRRLLLSKRHVILRFASFEHIL